MICSNISALWQWLLSFFCALPLKRQQRSKSAQIILMPRLRMFRKRSSTQKQFAGRLQQSSLQLVWVQDRTSSQKTRGLQLNRIFQRKQETPSGVNERSAATGTDNK